jgi:hypothetical protein
MTRLSIFASRKIENLTYFSNFQRLKIEKTQKKVDFPALEKSTPFL